MTDAHVSPFLYTFYQSLLKFNILRAVGAERKEDTQFEIRSTNQNLLKFNILRAVGAERKEDTQFEIRSTGQSR